MRRPFASLLLCSSAGLASSFITSPQAVLVETARRSLSDVAPLHLKTNFDDDDNDAKNPMLPNNIKINPIYFGLATAETIFWYYLAPGIDPDSRWFAPVDGVLISKLLDPSVVLQQPGYAFSSLLLNCFLLLPMIWAILLLQEEKDQVISPLPFCLAGFVVGGGALIPYMIVRRRPNDVDRANFSAFLNLFEPKSIGPKLLGLLTAIVLFTCFAEVYNSNFQIEWDAFVDRLHHSQFISLALFDFTMLSITIVDPMLDDAKRRRYLDHSDTGGVRQVAPFLIPLLGPVAWILSRPRPNLANEE